MSETPFGPELGDPSGPLPLPSGFPWHPAEPRARRSPASHTRPDWTPPPVPHALAAVSLGTTIAYRGLALTPLIGPDDPACDYLTLEDALSLNLVSIREVSPSLVVLTPSAALGLALAMLDNPSDDLYRHDVHVFNRANRPLLIVDGEELVGSFQNRVVNLSMLVGGRSEADIPVSCVERLSHDTETFRFRSAARMQFASGRADKMAHVSRSLASREQRQSNQAAIWAAIEHKAARMQVSSPSEAMADIYEQHAAALEEYVKALEGVDRQRGAVFTVSGRLAGMELFDCASTWRRLMPKIVRSYAVEALDEQSQDQEQAGDVSPGVLLDILSEAESRSYASFGEGFDVRIRGTSVNGAALVFGSRIVHLAAFASRFTHRAALP
jgi:ARG/rhodanese/phosphatase superfamily protein